MPVLTLVLSQSFTEVYLQDFIYKSTWHQNTVFKGKSVKYFTILAIVNLHTLLYDI